RVRPVLGGGLVMAEPLEPLQVGINPRHGMGARPAKAPIFERHRGTDAIMPRKQAFRRGGAAYGQIYDPEQVGRPHPAGELMPLYRHDFLLQPPPGELGPWTRNFVLRL